MGVRHPSRPHDCPADAEERAEAYLLGHLSASETMVFEDHYFTCDACAQRVEAANCYVRAMKAAGATFIRRTRQAS